ncbi:MAG TPA: hypothetical protein VI685_26890 [Candidatus Angelobacter sp.]
MYHYLDGKEIGIAARRQGPGSLKPEAGGGAEEESRHSGMGEAHYSRNGTFFG